MSRIAFLALTASGIFWGLGFPLGKLSMRELPAAHMVLLRFSIAALAAAPFALRTAEARRLLRSPAVLTAGALYGVAFMVQFEGLAHVSVALAALIVGVMPALIARGAPFLGERVTKISWFGVAAATLGAALVAGRPGEAGSLLGVTLSLLALLLFLAWVVALKRAPEAKTPMAMPSVTVIVAAFTILPISLLMHGPPRLDLSPVAWGGVIGQGVLSTLLATAAWQYGSARVASASAGVFINIEPLFGAAVGVTFFHDRLTAAAIVGGLLIVAGSLTVVLGERPRPHEITALPPTPG